MKKFLLLLSVALCVSVYAALELKASTMAETVEKTNFASGKYKQLQAVSCYIINVETGERYYPPSGCGTRLCKDDDGTFYLYIWWPSFDGYYNVYRNGNQTFKGKDVSAYNYYAQKGNHRYFFFY